VSDVLPSLPPRNPCGHKGVFGTVAVVGGCTRGPVRMIGAPALAALGALRAGAGLVRLVMPEPILDLGIVLCSSATGRCLPVDAEGNLQMGDAIAAFDQAIAGVDALAIGPGWGEGEVVAALALRAVQQEDCPVVVDADALNALAELPDLYRDFHARAILTPHPGEFNRLARGLRINRSPTTDTDRPAAAEELARRLGCIVVLKGAGTVVSDGHSTWVSSHRLACLGTAGTGDVLTGVIAGLLAQHARQPDAISLYDIARLGVEAHARAAMLWCKAHHTTGGMLATELCDHIPQAVESLRSSHSPC
jgi:hydroxyethylthiazole kinase-like uncharacterized protein yjeF